MRTTDCPQEDLESTLSSRAHLRRSRRLLALVQQRPFRWLMAAPGASRSARSVRTRWNSRQAIVRTGRSRRWACSVCLRAEPTVALGAHIEALLVADVATVQAVRDAACAAQHLRAGDDLSAAHATLQRVHTQVRGFINSVPVSEQRAFFISVVSDPLFEAVFQRVLVELSYERRYVAVSAAHQLRDLAEARNVYQVLSGVCAMAPCTFEELWPLVNSLR